MAKLTQDVLKTRNYMSLRKTTDRSPTLVHPGLLITKVSKHKFSETLKEQRRKGKDRKIHGNRAGTLLPSTARRMRATLGSGPIQMFTEHLPTSIYEGLIPQYPEEIGMYSLFAPLQVLQRSW